MKIRRKLLAGILICSGTLVAGFIWIGLVFGIIVACATWLWMDYDESAYQSWLRMYRQIIDEHGGWYL